MKEIVATLPERLACALAVDTSILHAAGWSDPPAARRVLYYAPEPATAWRGRRQQTARKRSDPTVARFVLAGRPRPRIEDAVKIGELMRLAALAQFGWTKDEATGRWQPKAPSVISGRDPQNRPLRAAEHRHAFWLPEDVDSDGEIDHLIVYAQQGLSSNVRHKLDRLNKLWVEGRRSVGEDDDAEPPGAHQEWRLALEGFGTPADFSDASRLLTSSRIWKSVTPFLAAGHLKADGYAGEIRRLANRRGLPEPREIAFLRSPSATESEGEGKGDPYGNDVGVVVRGRLRRAIHFQRFRSRGGERQLDMLGTFVRLSFDEPVQGPLALGYACHFGLGLFTACTKDD
jgi:CRISPR-associated protein Csb2